MPTLTHLPGGPERIEAKSFKTALEAIQAIRRKKAATATGPNGCINVWIDSAGCLRAHLLRFQNVVNEGTFETENSLEAWLNHSIREIRQPNERTAGIIRGLMRGSREREE